MKWSDRYATGIARVDAQHRMIFKMSEDLRDALDEGGGERVYGGMLQSLRLYARAHFRFEEDCMERYRCPVAQANKEAHAKFVVVLTEFQEQYGVTGFDPVEARRLVYSLDRWLADHICRIDVRLKDRHRGLAT